MTSKGKTHPEESEMREFAAIIAALVVVIVSVFLVGIVVCPLAIAFESFAIALVGAGVGLPFSFYIGYLVAKRMLAN
jgi:hypothetical protein